jgi:hypothetical protein
VPKSVRAEVGRAWNSPKTSVNHAADGALIKTATAGAEKHRRTAVGRRQPRPSRPIPALHGLHGRNAERYGPLLVALAEHPHNMPRTVEIIDVETHQLAHSDTGRVQQFEHRVVTQPLGVGSRAGNKIGLQGLVTLGPFDLSWWLQQSDGLSL